MKHLRYLLSLLIITFTLTGCDEIFNTKHLGIWRSNGEPTGKLQINFQFEFKKNHVLILSVKDSTGRYKAFVDDHDIEFKYYINYNQDPVDLDIIVDGIEPQANDSSYKSIFYKGIIRFINDDLMELQYTFGTEARPTAFENTKETESYYQLLERVKQNE